MTYFRGLRANIRVILNIANITREDVGKIGLNGRCSLLAMKGNNSSRVESWVINDKGEKTGKWRFGMNRTTFHHKFVKPDSTLYGARINKTCGERGVSRKTDVDKDEGYW
ncbi:hypothetical protein L198_06009 [Cryptococcus wingfieldii CBS 7118]|uniref:Uncharacterized protein n=1 Tax=Cryptococcus wingfieldii CBS 7118 TaxID=1295528 RepID=A0A1E3ISD6_9TREE|nr:hypothetical protein L198_06009 [Cryptococcus wingfieldii CBS 7118]ODN91489.1 hypothetical protein L198_06009 [Cryptococcus wingfieldii CBS 7118]